MPVARLDVPGGGEVPKGVMVVQTARPEDPVKDKEFNEWYTNVHIPELLDVPGFVGARRYRALGDVTHQYLAVYEIDADDVSAPMKEYGKRSAEGKTTTTDAMPSIP